MNKEERIEVGVPGLVFLPARHYKCKVLIENYVIKIPRKGSYYDLDNNFFTKHDGDFNILDEDNGVLYLPSIMKVLFGVSKYPDLEDNQLFSPIYMVFEDEEIKIVGQLIEVMERDE